MTAVRMRARDLMTEQELVEVRTRSTLKSVGLIAHAWALILGSIAMVAVWPNPFTFVLAVAVIGSRQLGLAILMHDGAHGCLANGEKLNMALSQWLCAYPVFAETEAYRRYHLQHHARTQQDDDPDLILSAPFPITGPSYRRKFWRDISGQTGYAQRKAQLLNALGDRSWPLARRAAHFRDRLGRQIIFNLVLLAALAAAGVWWAYPLLWLLPLVTWMMVITRIRNIAEHAVVPDSNDPLRNTRTTRAGFLERLFIAPYYVNYHLEHHLLFYVPCYNLPRVHEILSRGPHAARMEVQPNYAAVLRLATAKPANEDRPGALVSNVRRARAGVAVDNNQVSSGFFRRRHIDRGRQLPRGAPSVRPRRSAALSPFARPAPDIVGAPSSKKPAYLADESGPGRIARQEDVVAALKRDQPCPGMRLAISRPCANGMAASSRQCRTSVGATMPGRRSRTLTSPLDCCSRAAFSAEAEIRCRSLNEPISSSVASGSNSDVRICRKAGLSCAQPCRVRVMIASRRSISASFPHTRQPCAKAP